MVEEPQDNEQLRFRRRIDQAGWARLSHALTLDHTLNDGAYRLYALLLKYARQASGCWPGVRRLAQDLGKTERTITNRLSELTNKGLVTRERRFGRSSVTWIEDLEKVYADHLPERLFEQEKSFPFERLFEQEKTFPIEQPSEREENFPIEQPSEQEKGFLSEQTFESERNFLTIQEKNCLTEEETKKKKQHDGGVLKQQNDSLEKLVDFGVSRTIAKRIARERSSAEVLAWLAYTRRAIGLQNPQAFVVRRLLDGELAPEENTKTQGADRYALKTGMCPSCYLIRPVEYICPECDQCFNCCTCIAEVPSAVTGSSSLQERSPTAIER